MALRSYKPITPSLRFKTNPTFEEITTSKPEKSLLRVIKKNGGRNNHGHITIRHRGGGHKRRFRLIDFQRELAGVKCEVKTIEYDPNRSSRIALVQYETGEKRYILAPKNLKVGMVLESSNNADINPGNTLPLGQIPVGTMVHNVELKIGKGGQIARSAGTYAQILGREEDYVILRLPSTEVRKIHRNCKATIGEVGNSDHGNVTYGKAGKSRWLGRRPKVRGVAMNPVDHPMGGGEGRSSGGRHPCSPWGLKAKGVKTRSKKNPSNKFIISRRKHKR